VVRKKKQTHSHILQQRKIVQISCYSATKFTKRRIEKRPTQLTFSFMIPLTYLLCFIFQAVVLHTCTTVCQIKHHGLQFIVKKKHQITVLGKTPMSECPTNPMEPVVARETKFMCCWFCKTGPITAEIQLNKSGFVPGVLQYQYRKLKHHRTGSYQIESEEKRVSSVQNKRKNLE